jgi:hypothetical protein
MKKIKLFENYTNEIYEKEIVDFLYERLEKRYSNGYFPIYEDDEDLTSGERAAMSRDNQVISRPQLAALYLKALGRAEGEDGAYLVMIDGIKDFGEFDPNTRAFMITNPALADAIGLESTGTISRTVNKFVNLIDGVGETSGEILYPKVIKAFEVFSTMNPVQISNLAGGCIQNADTYTVNRDKALLSRDASAQRRQEKLKEADLIGQKVYSLIGVLKRNPLFKLEGKAQRMAIAKISRETEESEDKIKEYYRKYLMDRKILNAANFYDK